MIERCGQCEFFVKYEKDNILGTCISDKCKIKSKGTRTEFSKVCNYKKSVDNVDNSVEKVSNKKLGTKFEQDWANYLWKNKKVYACLIPGKLNTRFSTCRYFLL